MKSDLEKKLSALASKYETARQAAEAAREFLLKELHAAVDRREITREEYDDLYPAGEID
jgi:hypothetical protein